MNAGSADDPVVPGQATEDEVLFADLRRLAATIDSVPDEVRVAAQAAIGTRDLDRHLAVLVADSAGAEDSDLEPDRASSFEQVRAGTAGSQTNRLLSFSTGGLHVDLEVTAHGDGVDVIGQVTGAPTEEGVLEYANGRELVLELDSLGRFLIEEAPHGCVRARLRTTVGAQVMTAWVTI